MRTRDHELLGKYLLQKEGQGLSTLDEIAFVIGNIEPDYNPFTYLHGMWRAKKFYGHNYENVLPIMQKLYVSLQKSRDSKSILKYYHMGKLIHYTADAFTYPHNEKYKKGLREHCRYERQLHKRFLLALQEEMHRDEEVPKLKEFGNLEAVHEVYLQNVGDYSWDCKYIFMTSSMLIKSMIRESTASARLEEIRV